MSLDLPVAVSIFKGDFFTPPKAWGDQTYSKLFYWNHAGGSIPYLAERFAIIDEMGFIAGAEQRGTAADMFRRIYWDTALAASDPVLRMNSITPLRLQSAPPLNCGRF